MENSSAESAAVLKPSSLARSARSPRISATILRLSVLPPLAPRMIQALNAFSRKSRRAEYCRKGSMLERDSVMACLPLWPRSLDGLNLRVGVGAGEVEEHGGSAVERVARAFQRIDRIGERRRRRVAGNGRDLFAVGGKAPIEGRHEVLDLDPVERRHLERRG